MGKQKPQPQPQKSKPSALKQLSELCNNLVAQADAKYKKEMKQ